MLQTFRVHSNALHLLTDFVLSSASLSLSSASLLSSFEEGAWGLPVISSTAASYTPTTHQLQNHRTLLPASLLSLLRLTMATAESPGGVAFASSSSSSCVICHDTTEMDVIHCPLLPSTQGTSLPSCINNEAPTLHPCHMLIVIFVVDSSNSRVAEGSPSSYPPLWLICCLLLPPHIIRSPRNDWVKLGQGIIIVLDQRTTG